MKPAKFSENVENILKGMPDKPPKMWSVNDYQLFLDKIELFKLKKPFKENSVDGSVFFDIKIEDFPELIKGRLLFQKIILWQDNLKEVQLVREKDPKFMKKPLNVNQKPIIQIKKPKKRNFDDEEDEKLEVDVPERLNKNKIIKEEKADDSSSQSETEIKVIPKIQSNFKKNKLSVFSKNDKKIFDLIENSGFIGRQKDLFITIPEQDISRKHCEIIYKEEGYYLRDNNSVNGTYVFIATGTTLFIKNGTSVMIGTTLFEFKDIIENKSILVNIYIEDLNKIDKTLKLDLSVKINHVIGKRVDTDIKIEEDPALDEVHAVITVKKDINMITMEVISNQGVWLKLDKNDRYPLVQKTEFRVGTSYQYGVSNAFIKPFIIKPSKICCICEKEERNAVIFPCKHKVVGPKCLEEKRITACPECFGFVQQFMKVFV